MKRIALLLSLILAGCGRGDPPPPRAAEPKLDLIAFFTGPSSGKGTIDIIFQHSKPLQVISSGKSDGRGSLVLDQRLAEGSKVRRRRWVMKCSAAGNCDGTLTDASGPVRVQVAGNAAHIRYRMPNRLDVDQWLTLRADRRTIDNRLRVFKWGFRVATVDEVIRRGP